jgi:hypothetical protein
LLDYPLSTFAIFLNIFFIFLLFSNYNFVIISFCLGALSLV